MHFQIFIQNVKIQLWWNWLIHLKLIYFDLSLGLKRIKLRIFLIERSNNNKIGPGQVLCSITIGKTTNHLIIFFLL